MFAQISLILLGVTSRNNWLAQTISERESNLYCTGIFDSDCEGQHLTSLGRADVGYRSFCTRRLPGQRTPVLVQ
jgi:hypothetical protein